MSRFYKDPREDWLTVCLKYLLFMFNFLFWVSLRLALKQRFSTLGQALVRCGCILGKYWLVRGQYQGYKVKDKVNEVVSKNGSKIRTENGYHCFSVNSFTAVRQKGEPLINRVSENNVLS